MKMRAIWDIAPFPIMEADRRFRGAYCFHHQGVRMIAVDFHSNDWLTVVGRKMSATMTMFVDDSIQ
jgi:hypothetical protein